MSLQRSLLPITRSSRYAFNYGRVAHRGLSIRNVHERQGLGVGLAVASTIGLSLATYYVLLVDPIHADRSPDRELETILPQGSALRGDEEIRALRARKSVDSFCSRTSKNIEALLKRYEETHHPSSASGVSRYDIAQVASNDPLEDDHSEAFVTSGDSQWSFFTVIDGHNGWETSALLREELIKSVATELAGIATSGQATDAPDPFAEAIARAFTRLDDKIVHKSLEQVFQTKSRRAGIDLLSPAYAGACALLAFYDAKNSLLRVALTGDCRAVLGRRRLDGKFELEVLTTDQTGFDPDERKRVEAAHPGEQVVKDGRTMGFGPSRVFGDARYKWSREVQDRLKKYYLGRTVLDSIKTPPYFTAEPVVKATSVKPGDFLVLATDGLWECLTNREAVGLVAKWVQQHESGEASWTDTWNQWWGGGRSAVDSLPVVCNGESSNASEDSMRYSQWCAEKKFVTIDANAATHLVRNAIGGADEDLREALLSIKSPRARTYLDDITATVVFFG